MWLICKGWAPPENTEHSQHLNYPDGLHLDFKFKNSVTSLSLFFNRTLNSLWLPENLILRHPDFQRAYDLLDVDKKQILGENEDPNNCRQ